MSKNSYEININGNNYLLKTERSKEETDKIVNYVDREIEKANNSLLNKYINPTMSATLACLNIADDLYRVGKEFENLKEISKEPLEKYEPLRDEFEEYKEKHKDADQKIADLLEKLDKLETSIELLTIDRDKYKLELDRQNNIVKKAKEDNEILRSNLLEQEKLTLQTKKQLQELLKR